MDTFGRLTAVIIAIVLFIGLPLQHEARVLDNGANKEIFHEMSKFIDQVCFMGELHKPDYMKFLNAIDAYGSSITVAMELHTPTYTIVKEERNDGEVAFEEETYMDVVYTKEIMDVLDANKRYTLLKGDMLTLRITLVKHPILLQLKNIVFFTPTEETFVYGGIVS